MQARQLWIGTAALFASAAIAACGEGKRRAAVDTLAAAKPAAPAPPPLMLNDLAGTWKVHAVPMTGDSTPTDFELVATGSTQGWSMNFRGRPPLPVNVTAAGDSLVLDAGPYTGVRSRGVKVSTTGVARLSGGNLVGTIVAHYVTNGVDSTLVFRSIATRAQSSAR